jgi:hypothetical protein
MTDHSWKKRDEGEEAVADGPAKKKNGKSAGSAARK